MRLYLFALPVALGLYCCCLGSGRGLSALAGHIDLRSKVPSQQARHGKVCNESFPVQPVTSWQMMHGQLPWLPQFLARRSFDIAPFRNLVARAVPYLNRVERLLRPRLPLLSSPAAMKVIGAVCLVLSAIMIACFA